jgi:PTS system galactitol-specific IIA component
VFEPALSLVQLDAPSAAAGIRALASRLFSAGYVKSSFEQAALVRERKSPTGLPFSPWAVALPHADPEHGTTPRIALATLSKPVVFRQMGSPAVSLEVSIIVMPAFTAKEQAAASLTHLMTLLQAVEIRENMLKATTPEELLSALSDRWDAS